MTEINKEKIIIDIENKYHIIGPFRINFLHNGVDIHIVSTKELFNLFRKEILLSFNYNSKQVNLIIQISTMGEKIPFDMKILEEKEIFHKLWNNEENFLKSFWKNASYNIQKANKANNEYTGSINNDYAFKKNTFILTYRRTKMSDKLLIELVKQFKFDKAYLKKEFQEKGFTIVRINKYNKKGKVLENNILSQNWLRDPKDIN